MSKMIITESSDELISKAEKDIMNVKVLLVQKFYPANLMYDVICFHITQAVEKLLKSFIISNGISIKKTHNLDELQKTAIRIDDSFKKINKECVSLNEFVPNIKYSEQEPITKQNINKAIKSLETICNFSAIKTMRESFGKKHKFKITAEIVTRQSTKTTSKSTTKKNVNNKKPPGFKP